MSSRLRAISGNSQRLDGGSMYGNCPRAVWERWSPPDEQGRILLACRALLVQEADRRILFETGIGAFFEPKLRERYGVIEEEHVLLRELEALGIQPEDIDIVVLSHLHFDNAGGMLSTPRKNEAPALAFPRATVLVGSEAWD